MNRRHGWLLGAFTAVLAVAIAFASHSSMGAGTPVAVFPSQGTPVASPVTQISFRGAPPSQLTGITVTGSVTGAHPGTLKAHSDGQGASFLPSRPFKPGEQVTVRSNAPLVGAAPDGSITFGVAVPDPTATIAPPAPDPAGTPREAQHFHSEHKLRPPSIKVLRHTSAAAPGYLFLGAKAGPGQDGPMIVDQRGRLVWFHRVPHHTSAADFRAQTYQGRPVLTWWQGPVLQGEGFGEGLILDSTYKRIARVQTGNGYKADLHEFLLTPRNTAFVIAYVPVKWDLSSIGGPADGVALDSLIQEIDVKTGLVMFEWHSLGHVDLRESFAQRNPSVAYDLAHVNSVDVERDGNLLVSARNTSALYEIDSRSGNILYRVGGKRSDYAMGAGTQALGQHDARRLPDGTISMFDNGAPPVPGRESRGLNIKLDPAAKTATLVRDYKHPNPALKTISQGGVQLLPNNDLFVGWGGSNSFMTEFDRSGNVVFDAQFRPTGDDSYRAYKLPWRAQPFRAPAISALAAKGRTTVWASWNGATGVAKWELLAGSRAGALKAVRRRATSGFETAIGVGGSQKLVQVRALDATGKVLATSRVLRPRH